MKNKLYTLIGIPASGKSTYIKNNFPENVFIISRDSIVEENSHLHIFDKKIDKLLSERFSEAVKHTGDVIIDMTNLTLKSRKKIQQFPKDKFYKIAVLFPFKGFEKEILEMARRRVEKPIPESVLNQMISSFYEPSLEEGFDEILIQDNRKLFRKILK